MHTTSNQCKPDEIVKIKTIKKKGNRVYAVPSDYVETEQDKRENIKVVKISIKW